MTDIQLMVLALSVIIPISLLIVSNSRITDAKETLRAEIQTVRTEMQRNHGEVIASLERIAALIDTKFKIHELEHHRNG